MKRLIPVVLAVLVGCLFSYVLFRKVEKDTLLNSTGNAIAIQIGVFTNLENAERLRDMHGGLVFQDNDLYRVYYSILSQDVNIDFITEHLSNNGVNYYLKKVTVDESLIDESYEYETLMANTNEKSKLTINEELLALYKDVK